MIIRLLGISLLLLACVSAFAPSLSAPGDVASAGALAVDDVDEEDELIAFPTQHVLPLPLCIDIAHVAVIPSVNPASVITRLFRPPRSV